MSEEEKKLVEKFKKLYIKDFNGEPITTDDRLSYIECALITNLIEKLEKELNTLKEIEQQHKEENGKLRIELEQVVRKVEEYRIGWCNTGEELEQEKLKNKDMKSAVEYLKEIEPEKLKIIADSWNDKVAHKFDTEIKELTQKAFEDGQESIVKRYISKDKIKEKIEDYEKMIKATFEDTTWYGQNRRDKCYEILRNLNELLEEK